MNLGWHRLSKLTKGTAFVFLMCSLLCVLRSWSTYYLWTSGTSFEEIQTGSHAATILNFSYLPVEFRYTNLTGALGFSLFGYNLKGLRGGFILLGIISVVFFITALRQAKVGPLATWCIGFLVSIDTYFTNISYLADESCVGVSLCLILFSLLIISESDSQFQALTFCLVGLMSGIALYEYAGYKILFGLGFCYAAIRCLVHRGRGRDINWKHLVAFIFTVFIVGFPIWSSLLIEREGSGFFFDSVNRHIHEREGYIAKDFVNHFYDSLRVIGGMSLGDIRLSFQDGTMVSSLWGIAAILASIYAIFQRKLLSLRLISLHGWIAILGFASIPNNFEAVKLTPAIVSFFVCLPFFIDWLCSVFMILLGQAVWGLLETTLALLVIGMVFSTTSTRLTHMRQSKERSILYTADEFLSCLHIRKAYNMGVNQIIFNSPKQSTGCAAPYEASWITHDLSHKLLQTQKIPAKDDIHPGTLVVLGDKWGLDAIHVALLEYIASNERSELLYTRNAGDDLVAVSVCYECRSPSGS